MRLGEQQKSEAKIINLEGTMESIAEKKKKATPFIKWAGGKSWLYPQFKFLFPQRKFSRYFEPFLGGGAVFFNLNPSRAILSDLNSELIACYRAIKAYPHEILNALQKFQKEHSEKRYYEIRNHYNNGNIDGVERTAAFIYLNKTAYNGLFRVNGEGKFNVPHGSYKNNPTIFNRENILAVSEALQKAELVVNSFESVLDKAEKNDFIYFDPPYYSEDDTSSFTSYTKDGFGKEEQIKLSDVVHKLHEKGCLIMLSNSPSLFIEQLYSGMDIKYVKANRRISSKANGRKQVKEIIVRNFEGEE